ncbi:MAG TPA: hypothetical protein VKC34_05300, partial [Blastocatellia bacterium]|nr:hypothetical protein [Blastocatellia bacterium]
LGSGVETRGRLLIAWYGPRGLSSLLLILLPVFAGLPGSDHLFAVCSLVVLMSVVLHGGSPMLMARAARKRATKEVAGPAGGDVVRELGPRPAIPDKDDEIVRHGSLSEQPAAPNAPRPSSTLPDSRNVAACSTDSVASCRSGAVSENVQVGTQRISLEELNGLWQAKWPVTILDVRTERSLEGSGVQARGAVRMPPDHMAERARELGLEKEAWLIAYCA